MIVMQVESAVPLVVCCFWLMGYTCKSTVGTGAKDREHKANSNEFSNTGEFGVESSSSICIRREAAASAE